MSFERQTFTFVSLRLSGSIKLMLVGWLDLNVPFQHKYGYIRDESNSCVKLSESIDSYLRVGFVHDGEFTCYTSCDSYSAKQMKQEVNSAVFSYA